MMTIAAEKFSEVEVEYLVNNGIILSVGHSNATYEQTENLISKGVTTCTHLFNAMSGLVARSPGVIGAILNSPTCYAGIIPDLFHVHKANIQLTTKLKP
jgi:N-acetylglucosamine-6-phosphate deacetylase